MSFFGKRKTFLGVDIGTASIKVVELAPGPNHTPRLVTYGRAEYTGDATKVDAERDIERIVTTLKAICAQARTTSRRVSAALPTFAVFSSVITLPAMSEKELAAAIRWEARKFVPLPLEEMILDWKFLADTPAPVATGSEAVKTPKKNIRVLLTAAPQNLVKKYLTIFRDSQLELLSLETEAFALERSLVGGAREVVMVVDLGAVTTDICVIENGIPILNRSIDVGGLTITKAIANSLNVDIRRAEQFKRDIGLNAQGSAAGGIPRTIEATISPIVNDIKYNFSLYQSQSARPIDKIILTGGSSYLPRLPEYLENLFQIKVYIGDPWARVSYPVELKPVLDEVGPQFASAIGLAMRQFI
ncbi:MAG: type IV pilus assembly protein PilM [Candidatus Veblenbacteria bacterium]|nr:type IV pilus assembly protein PilM [Candidatus Veblenbacteria bacterium]MDZ4229914.1 type IV pilus assembly protein PilM [Candidatus Veblenbacteria bacterium]